MVRNEMDEDRSGSRSPLSGVSRSGSRNSLNNGHCSTRSSSVHLYQCQGATQVCFFRNGDPFYQGLKLAVSAEKYKEYDSLLAELSIKMDLKTGAVRHIFDAEDGRMISDISQLQPGTAYVCCSSPSLIKMDGKYGKCRRQQWSLHTKGKNQCLTNWPAGGDKTQTKPHKKPSSRGHAAKLVTVFKNGKFPQKKVTMILNQRFITLDQVLDRLSEKETLGKVDKLFTMCGTRQIKELDELFEDDTTFYTALTANERFFDTGETTPSHRSPYRDIKRPSTGGIKRSSSVRSARKRRDSGGSQSGDSGRHPVRRSQSVKGTSSGRSSRGRSESPGPLNGHSPRSKSPKSPISPGKKTPNGMGNGNEELYPAQVFEKDSSDTERPDSSNGMNDQGGFLGI